MSIDRWSTASLSACILVQALLFISVSSGTTDQVRMSVNRYNPYHNTAPARSQPGQYQTQPVIAQNTAQQRNYEPAVWQWVPDSPEDLRGSFRVLMSGLPTENVAKKEIVVCTPVDVFSRLQTPDLITIRLPSVGTVL